MFQNNPGVLKPAQKEDNGADTYTRN